MKLKLSRPLAFFDIESTGTNKKYDRIVDLAVVKLLPDGSRATHSFRVNPEMPIPAAATAVHGIRDADVAGCPTFAQQAAEIAAVFDHCDLSGYNILGFDIPLLQEEFRRVGHPFSMDNRRVVDVQRIYHKKEPRDLSAALSFYCGELHFDAHQALDDVLATIRVLEGQFQRYNDLPVDVTALSEFCNPRNPEWVDRTGKLKWDNGEAVINFGRSQGKKLRDLLQLDPGFIKWMLNADFPDDTKSILRNAMAGVLPTPPPPAPAHDTPAA
jgi:DNA polymerase-3 subunit epsilon